MLRASGLSAKNRRYVYDALVNSMIEGWTSNHWARTIVEAFLYLDGLRYNSRLAGVPCLALFLPAVTAMPTRPKLSVPLTHPDLARRIAGAAKRLGYSVV